MADRNLRYAYGNNNQRSYNRNAGRSRDNIRTQRQSRPRADYQKKSEFVYGNTVRQVESVPVERPRTLEPEKEKPYKQQPVVKTAMISGPVFLVFLAVVGLVVFMGLNFMREQNRVKEIRNHISVLEAKNEETRRRQEDRISNINDKIDLSMIYDKAVNEYGMVDASENKTFTYNTKKSDIVKQYSDVPK
jgi:cell division protein FtsL